MSVVLTHVGPLETNIIALNDEGEADYHINLQTSLGFMSVTEYTEQGRTTTGCPIGSSTHGFHGAKHSGNLTKGKELIIGLDCIIKRNEDGRVELSSGVRSTYFLASDVTLLDMLKAAYPNATVVAKINDLVEVD